LVAKEKVDLKKKENIGDLLSGMSPSAEIKGIKSLFVVKKIACHPIIYRLFSYLA